MNELTIQLEADRMRNSLIADSDRQSEMTVVRNELERGQNEPSEVLDEAVYAAAFREHPYHHPTIGWRADVEGVPTSRLKEFYDTFYHPNNATVILVGDFDEQDALALINKYFGAYQSSAQPIPQVYTEEPPQQGEHRLVIRRAGELALVQIADIDAQLLQGLFGQILAAEADQRHLEAVRVEAGDHPAKQAFDAVHPRAFPAKVIADLQHVENPRAHVGGVALRGAGGRARRRIGVPGRVNACRL